MTNTPPSPDPLPDPAPDPKPGMRDALGAFRHRNFALFWTGALFSNTGTWVENVTVPFMVFGLTGSAAWLGFAAFMQFIPIVAVGPVAGAVADRMDRHKVLIVTQVFQAVVAVGLWMTWLSGHANIWAIIALVTLSGAVTGINAPSWQAFVSDLVPRESLLNAVTLNSTQFNAARAFGPALGGLVLGTLGASWALFINVVSFVAVIGALLMISMPESTSSPVTREPSESGVLREFFGVFSYVKAFPGIVAAYVIVVALGTFGSPVFGLLVVFARRVFMVGDTAYGLLGAALGIGSILSAPFIAGRGSGVARSRLTGLATFSYGIALAMFALAPWYWVGFVALVVAGGGYLAISATLNTAIQLQVDEEMRGKVLGMYVVLLTLAIPVGSLLQGWLVGVIGPRQTVAAAAMLFVAVMVWVRYMSGLMGHLDDDRMSLDGSAATGYVELAGDVDPPGDA